MSNLLKGYFVNVEDDSRVVDVSALLETRMREEEEKRARLAHIEEESYDSDEFFEGLPVENIDALIDEDSESAIIKSNNDAELNRIRSEIDSAQEELENCKAEAGRLIEEARAEAEQIKQTAYEEGHAEGYEAGVNEGMASVETMKADLSARTDELENDYQNKITALEPQFVDALTDIYEHIFKVDLDTYRNVVASLLTDAINNSDGARNIIIHISRDDFHNIIAQKEEILTETGMLEDNVDFVQDATLGPASCLIETENGVFDCSLETELKELKRKLMLLAYRK
ncbi:MAG: hypothetical protein K5870_09870 [Lachnospiraceae bacterium]|nr:hypothetical protein [Lachnospiraceae bacterium]